MTRPVSAWAIAMAWLKGADVQQTQQPWSAPSRLALIADDEEMIRNIACICLERIGYDVLHAGNGEEAVEVFRDHRAEIDVVILDMTMPKRCGDDVFRELRELRPDVKIILASGYGRTRTDHLGELGPTRFLGKPFRPQELIDLVRSFDTDSATVKSRWPRR